MKVLCFGNLGYVGTVLNEYIKDKVENYVGFDNGYFKNCTLTPEKKIRNQIIGDVRNITNLDLSKFDIIIYLAALSNDSLGKEFKNVTNNVNFKSCIKIANLAKNQGVRKFIFASSCSIYGTSKKGMIKESDTLNPITDYAKSKIDTEKELKNISSEKFKVICLRFATACGISNRMRFDIVLNDFVFTSIQKKKIILKSNGESFRPLIHVNDMCRAIFWACNNIQLENFLSVNVGCKSWNFRIIDLAKIVSEVLLNIPIIFEDSKINDPRSYAPDFTLFENIATNYQPEENIKTTTKSIFKEFSKIRIAKKIQSTAKFNRLRFLKELIKKGKINKNLQWI